MEFGSEIWRREKARVDASCMEFEVGMSRAMAKFWDMTIYLKCLPLLLEEAY
jgi:hypothetical protein